MASIVTPKTTIFHHGLLNCLLGAPLNNLSFQMYISYPNRTKTRARLKWAFLKTIHRSGLYIPVTPKLVEGKKK